MLRHLVLVACLVVWSSCQQQQTTEYLQPQQFQATQTQHRYYDPRYTSPEQQRSSSVGATTATPTYYYPPAPVHYVNIGEKLEGDYKFGYDTGNGPAGQSYREEVRLADGTVQGSYGYVDSRGRTRKVHYTAGKNGFQIIKDEIIKDKASTTARPPVQRSVPQPSPSKQSAPHPVQQQLQQYSTVQYYTAQQTVPQQQFAPVPAQPKSSQELQTEYFRRQLVSEQSVNRHRFAQPEQQQPFQLSLQQHQAFEQPLQQPVQDTTEQPAPPRRLLRKRYEQEPTTYDPPYINVGLLSYNIGTNQQE